MRFLAIIALLTLAAFPAQAEKIRYYQDPVYQKLNRDDPHPMNDLMSLAENNDVRAQFILADLYAKGKGGLSKNEKKAAYWFEQSARHGYPPSFIRLAALSKRKQDWIEAYKWYTLAIEQFRGGGDQKYSVKARNELAASAGLTQGDIKQARKAANDWKVMRVKEGQEEKRSKKIEKKAQPPSDEDDAEEEQPKREMKVNE